jgi:threonine aldolase
MTGDQGVFRMNDLANEQALIDLRSDTVTRPTPAMRKAMAEAPVGDDVYGDDPTVNRLQDIAADTLGMEAALYVPSGTQSNLCALLTHCERGDEYVVGQIAHTYKYEGGGGAVFASVQPQPLEFEADGTLDLEKVAAVIKPDDPHFARTRLLCLENTNWGRPLPLDYLADARRLVNEHGLALHLDGARLFNAAVKQQVPVTEITRHFDSVSVCLSKGLCAPVGSVLCGSRDFIAEAHRWRKGLGGGMRQAGIIAAAGILAITEQVPLLERDHENAIALANALQGIDGIDVDPGEVRTNMVFVRLDPARRASVIERMKERGILVSGRNGTLRLVTHFDFNETSVPAVADAFARVLKNG